VAHYGDSQGQPEGRTCRAHTLPDPLPAPIIPGEGRQRSRERGAILRSHETRQHLANQVLGGAREQNADRTVGAEDHAPRIGDEIAVRPTIEQLLVGLSLDLEGQMSRLEALRLEVQLLDGDVEGGDRLRMSRAN